MQVVILGMHRARTSLVSHIVHTMGVHMGDKMLGTHPSQPHGHWEDVEFYELNQRIMQSLETDWDHPPSVKEIESATSQFSNHAATLISKKSSRATWGWKDPRTCITLPIYWPHLSEPVFIFVKRNELGIIDSLMQRSGGSVAKWNSVIDRYNEGIDWAKSLNVPSISIDTDLLTTNRIHALTEVERLGKFLGASDTLTRQAIGVIHYS